MRGWIRNGLAAALAAGLLLGAGPGRAQEPAAEEAGLRARYEELFRQMLERPADLDVMFDYARLAERLGEYDAAISTLERMLIFNPDLPRVRLELAALYMRVGAYEMARVYLNQALEAPDVPPIVRERVEALLEEIKQRTSRHYFAGSVFGGLRYQTNANAGPTSGDVLGGGVPLQLGDEFRRQDDFNLFLSGLALHRYNLGTRHREFWETRATAYGAWQFDLTDLDLALLEVDTGPLLALFPDRWEGTTVRPFVTSNIVALGGDLLYTTVGAGAELAHRVGDRMLLTLEPALRHRQFRNSSAEPNGDDQTGVELQVTGGVRYRLQDDVLLFAEAGYAHDNTKAKYETNDEYGVALGLVWTYAAPFGDLPLPWELTAAVGFVATDYKAPDPNTVGPGGRERYDQEWRFSLANSFRITETWSVEAQLHYMINDSNVPNFERDNLSILLGVLASF